MRIVNPQRESETIHIFGTTMNRVDVEAGVFQYDNMQFLNGEYEAFLSEGASRNEIVLQVNVESTDVDPVNRRLIEERFVERLLKHRSELAQRYADHRFSVIVNVVGEGGLGLHKLKGRPKRLVDRRAL
jgi:phenylacetate-coenzyme A ligase PaaK-like adenylate-forming protein